MGHAFGAVQKAFTGLHVDTMSLAQPVSLYGVPVAGEIEDTFTNLLQASQRLQKIDSNMMQVMSLELLHATQAIDLRRQKDASLKLSQDTQVLFDTYRKAVPFVERDRIFTDDIAAGTKILNDLPNKTLSQK